MARMPSSQHGHRGFEKDKRTGRQIHTPYGDPEHRRVLYEVSSGAVTPVINPGVWIGWRTKGGVNVTNVVSVTFNAPLTETGTKTDFVDATGTYINYATSTIAGNTVGINNGSVSDVELQTLPDTTFIIKTGALATDLAGDRLWIGFSVGGDIAAASAANTMAFRFNPTDGDTTWVTVTRDAGATPTTNAVGATVTTDTQYILRIKVVSTALVEFYLNGVLVASHTTHLPVSTTPLGQITRLANTAGTTARNFRYQSMNVTQL